MYLLCYGRMHMFLPKGNQIMNYEIDYLKASQNFVTIRWASIIIDPFKTSTRCFATYVYNIIYSIYQSSCINIITNHKPRYRTT